MALKLNKENLTYIMNLVQAFMKEGKTLEQFITQFDLSGRQWEKYVSKNKKLQHAIEDGEIFFKAYMQNQFTKDIKRKRVNSQLAKMNYENAFGWTEFAAKIKNRQKPKKMYKVYLDLGPEEGNEDKFVPESGVRKDDKEKPDSKGVK